MGRELFGSGDRLLHPVASPAPVEPPQVGRPDEGPGGDEDEEQAREQRNLLIEQGGDP